MFTLIQKSTWFIRAIFYSLFFKKFNLPSYIGKPCFISGTSRISIGSKVRIFPSIRMEVAKNGLLSVGNNVAIAQNVHITCGESITIGDGACIAANVCITDTMHSYDDISVNVLGQIDRYSETVIGEDCFIGFGAVINAGSQLGKHCIVGANSYVQGVFPDNCIIVGSPAKILKKFNVELQLWELM